LQRLIADCDRMTADLDQEVRSEEDRVKIHDPAHIAYSTYAKATASRRDNLRRSADELRAHLAKAERALLELGVGTLDA
jgi:flagellar FliJ protein